ncbi:phosphate ABC transporter permease PstA [Thermocrinis minervae]|uniref:Phosphate transport system permease protein PstA n=1 Tax=Thermocrinis minervae TaxID=381751 RepID=A0A1M6RWG9_9AQUI|nr:phosphate ABC transporter permease PstA [Thermocrinis minervae]SHK36801.1 phosphate ABC transporter membrane protein 2, PhoT family [Thermocrinis minervae]
MKRRKLKNAFMLFLFTLMAAYGLFWLFWILGSVFMEGVSYLTPSLILEDPTPPGVEGGGLRPAFVGHFIITSIATLIGIPIGIMAGIYFAEYREDKLVEILRNVTELMVSTPSIVMGAVVYAFLVKPLHHFNALAGSVSLALLMVPVIAVATNEMLRLIPQQMREAAYALGAYKWQMIWHVTLKAAKKGIITAVLLGVARISGETAPLLFTAFNNTDLSFNLLKPMASLTVNIFNYVMGPYDYWHKQAWAAGFILTMGVLLFSILARLTLRTDFSRIFSGIVDSIFKRR